MKKFAPIVLFTYSRPEHTQRILDTLALNSEAKDSLLYIYCDGAKENASDEVISKINQVYIVVQKENRFKDVIIKKAEKNKGLATSIIEGVTEIVNLHGTVIVLEDDLVVSEYFLAYMNDSLERYENVKEVGQIGACNFFANGDRFPDFFFIPIPDCLGWAVWKDRWQHFNPDAKELLDQLEKNSHLKNMFDGYGSYDFQGLLKKQIQDNVSSWAIRWHAVCMFNQWKTLYPNNSHTQHIESKEATHANVNIVPPLQKTLPIFTTLPVVELDVVIEAMKLGYSGQGDYFGNKVNTVPVPPNQLKTKIKNLLKKGLSIFKK